MGCSGRVKMEDIRPEQKWDFISLNDFKSSSCFTPIAYGYFWVSLAISIAVYSVDTFTAVNLLAFNKWSGEIQPYIPLDISKWIFSACIIASWVNLGYEYIRAIRVMKRGAVAESYLDSLAVRLQCVRVGETGRGWRRFLVFAELTKSKKGAEYVALFTYFSFQTWLRIIFCQGPRQVVNALTLYSVFQAKLDPTDAKDVGSSLLGFFKNIGILASQQHQQAVILSGMVFTLSIWIFGALSLIIAMIFYITFLWHWIPNRDGGLSGYCERKINSRLSRIVSAKVNKALEEEERKRIKADAKAAKKGEKPLGRQATLPTLLDQKDDKLPNMPMLYRNNTTTTLPQYSSRPGTPSRQPSIPGFELDQLDQKRPFPTRNATGSSVMSTASFASNAPLLGNASDMGYGRSGSPAPSLPPLDTGFPGAPQRSLTSNSNTNQWNRGPPSRMASAMGDRDYTESPIAYTNSRAPGGPPRMPSAMGDRGYTESPVSFSDSPQSATDPYARPMPRTVGNLRGEPRSNTPMGAPTMGPRRMDTYGRQSPAPGSEYGRNSPGPSSRGSTSPTGNGGYQPFNPTSNLRSASSASPAPSSSQTLLYRNMTDPTRGPPPGGDYFSNAPLPIRPGTSNSQRSAPGRFRPDGPGRMASPAPYQNGGRGTPSGAGGGYRPYQSREQY